MISEGTIISYFLELFCLSTISMHIIVAQLQFILSIFNSRITYQIIFKYQPKIKFDNGTIYISN